MLDIIDKFNRLFEPLPSRIYNLSGSSLPLFLALRREPFVMVESSDEKARKVWRDVLFYRTALRRDASGICYVVTPDGPTTVGSRADVASRLFLSKTASSVIASSDALESPIWDAETLRDSIINLTKGKELGRKETERKLREMGYTDAPIVTKAGQYSMRNWILDVFPSTDEMPLRVEFFGDEIENMRLFDIDTQRSVREISEKLIMPASGPQECASLNDLIGDVRCYYSESADMETPEEGVILSEFPIAGEGLDAGLLSVKGLGITPDERKDISGLAGALERVSSEHRIVIVASSDRQAQRLKEVLIEDELISPIIAIDEIFDYEGKIAIAVGGLSAGLFLPGLLILTELEIFGGRPAYRALTKSKVSGLLTAIDDLQVGDHVVHDDRGIGRFEGLVHQKVEDFEYDLIMLEYLEGDRLYTPVDSIDKIRKYHAEEGVVPQLDSLRTKRWQKTKERVQKRIKEMAGKLLKIYAERTVSTGFSFSTDTELHREFDSFFPYEETPDQISAIADIKKDMEADKPMERLLAGDVGYGKTEVAMRAAFKAIYDGKQVAVLVPTTLLCEQHLRIFRKRFAGFPVTIDGLSRFKTKKDRLDVIKRVRSSEVDILIATHALLRADITFHDLGLLIIDEEHRFGVQQKERIKALKRSVDVLSMSATPIPRTLQMSLSGIRSMSVIETPPEERVAVKTVVSVFNEGIIREAIEREMHRGGQVFFVHNRIQDIHRIEKKLKRLVPLAKIAVAHGQMPEGELEKIMLSFLNMDVDVLLATAIVGSGLDIPTANTIIINMAERMGLADLYQLKGRVGRSAVRGYAYYLIPGGEIITEEARKRLQAIQEMSYMGAGFRLAMKDLEIRGAGNLLGTQQSGNIKAVGFDLYIEMLEAAVAELRGIEMKEKVRPEINIHVNAFIPEDYVEDMILRLSTYRKISSSSVREDLRDIEEEMTDRFGTPPEPFKNLLRVMELKILAEELLVKAVKQVNGHIRFTLSKDAPYSAEDLMRRFGERVKFHTEGFELFRKGDVYQDTKSVLESLKGI